MSNLPLPEGSLGDQLNKATIKRLFSNMERADRAISILGVLAKGAEVSQQVRNEIYNLLGITSLEPQEAAEIKRKLKAARKVRVAKEKK